MQPETAIPTSGRAFAIRLAAFYAATFAIAGAYMPFFPVWLQAVGFEPALIGLVMATPTLARLIAVPIVTGLAERHSAIRQAIVAASFLTFAGFAALGLMSTPVAIIGLLWLAACAWTPIVPMTDAYALRGVTRFGINYGPIRLWGSAAYVGGVLLAGAAGSYFEATHLVWVIGAIAGVAALVSLGIAPLDKPGVVPVQRLKAWKLLRDPVFLAIVSAGALIQGAHAAYYTFSSISWLAMGYSGATIAALWATCVAAEIVLFAVSPRLPLSSVWLIAIGGIGAMVRWLAMAYEPPLGALVILQTVHALSFGATHLGTMGLFASLVPGRIMASAQGYYVALLGIMTASAGTICGALFDRAGQGIYYGMAAMALTGVCVILVFRRRIEGAIAAKIQPQSLADGG